jgi:hypothetical protein
MPVLRYLVMACYSSPCPQCGEWDLDHASSGIAGEKIVMTATGADLPGMGRFCAHLLTQGVKTEGDNRMYHLTFNLAPGDDCATAIPESLRLTVTLSSHVGTDGSFADIRIDDSSAKQALLTAHGWNSVRFDPCSAGGGRVGAECMSVVLAQQYKRLALLAYEAQLRSSNRDATLFARRFHPATYAVSVAHFCDRREAESGSGGNPHFWSLTCQEKLIADKLRTIQAWMACTPGSTTRCRMPDQRFKRSKKLAAFDESPAD